MLDRQPFHDVGAFPTEKCYGRSIESRGGLYPRGRNISRCYWRRWIGWWATWNAFRVVRSGRSEEGLPSSLKTLWWLRCCCDDAGRMRWRRGGESDDACCGARRRCRCDDGGRPEVRVMSWHRGGVTYPTRGIRLRLTWLWTLELFFVLNFWVCGLLGSLVI